MNKNLVGRAVALCRKARECSRVELVFWLGISPSTAYMLWRYLKEACLKGLLDGDTYKCRYVEGADKIVFEEVGSR